MFGLTGIKKYLVYGIGILLLVAAIVLGVRGCAQDERNEDNAFINQGIVVEREAGQREVIKDVEEARDAVDNPTVNELNRVCGKYDRNC